MDKYSKLRIKNDVLSCSSTHICFRSVCYSNMFESVIHKDGHLLWK